MIKKINNLRLLLLVIGMILIAGTERAQAQHEHHGGQHSTPVVQPSVKKRATIKKQEKIQSPSVKKPKIQKRRTAPVGKQTPLKQKPVTRRDGKRSDTNLPAENPVTNTVQNKETDQTKRSDNEPTVEPVQKPAPNLKNSTDERMEKQHHHQPDDGQTENEGQTPAGQITPKDSQQPASAEVQTPVPQESAEVEEASSSMTLAELEEMAMANNPTLKQSDLAIRAAEGRKTQSGLLPNPVVGLSADDLSFRNFGDGAKVGFFIEQKIPLGGKLSKNRRVFEQEINKAEANREAQRARVLNSVRLLYFEALGAQRLVEIKKDLAKLAEESTDISAELYNVGLADRPDQIKTEIEQQRAEAEYLEARSRYEAVWQKIGAMVGRPGLLPVLLSGDLADLQSEIDSEELLADLLAQSPEIKTAQFQVERAKAVLKRARAEKVPDLYLRGGVGYNNELIERNGVVRRAGTEGFVEVGVSLPIFNRNQGGIKTAEAELAIAEREVERLQLALRTRFAQVLSDYRTALLLADKYAKQILPKAKIAYDMYSANFESMTAGYTNVLATRAAYLKAQVEYANKLTQARQSLVLLNGFLLSGGLSSPVENDSEKNEKSGGGVENPVDEDDEDQ